MIRLPDFLRQSAAFLRTLMLAYGVGTAALIALLLTTIALIERKREAIAEGEAAARVVEWALRASLPGQTLQGLLESYGEMERAERLNGLNVLLVVNDEGRILHASRPAWSRVMISDPILTRSETNDPDFLEVADCFARRQPNCLEIRSANLRLHVGSFTVVRPVQRPARDLGLRPERFLVLANFSPEVVLADFSQDLLPVALVSMLFSGILTAALWYLLASQLLPRLNQAAQTDGLTQLANRVSFMELAMEVLAEAEQREGQLVFAILDIDHFKTINDTYGHDCGDVALVSVAALLVTVLRPEDLLCRLGGEEFALLLSTSKEGGCKVLERLRLQLEMNRVSYNRHQIPLTASIGAAATSDCGYNIDYLYTAADKALYVAKSGGRNRIEWTDAASHSRLQLLG